MYTESMNAKELLAAGLQLDEVDRELIRDALTASLPDQDNEPEEVDPSLLEELARRSKEIDDGTAVLSDGFEVLERLRTNLAARRARRSA